MWCRKQNLQVGNSRMETAWESWLATGWNGRFWLTQKLGVGSTRGGARHPLQWEWSLKHVQLQVVCWLIALLAAGQQGLPWSRTWAAHLHIYQRPLKRKWLSETFVCPGCQKASTQGCLRIKFKCFTFYAHLDRWYFLPSPLIDPKEVSLVWLRIIWGTCCKYRLLVNQE